MYLCVRVDLDYVPWQSCGPGELPHSEPAMFIRLLDVVRKLGPRLHFFATEQVIRAFPSLIVALLQEGHDLDWLCLDPSKAEEGFEAARKLSFATDYELRGVAYRDQWPSDASLPAEAKFLSAKTDPGAHRTKFFPLTVAVDSDLVKASGTISVLDEDLRTLLRDHASRRMPATFAIQLPAIAMVDRQLMSFQRLINFAESIEMPIRTLRQVEGEGAGFRRILESP